MTPLSSRRDGASLLLAILVMLVIDAVVLTTLHLAMLERRLAENGTMAVRLRLGARSAAATALSPWTGALDSLRVGAPPVVVRVGVTPDRLLVEAVVEAVSGGLLLVRGTAREQPPGHGAAASVMLWLPPPLPADHAVAPAALSALSVQLSDDAWAGAAAGDSCSSGAALMVQQPPAAGAGTVAGAVRPLHADSALTHYLPPILAWTAAAQPQDVFVFPAAGRVAEPVAGIIIGAGDLTLGAGVAVHGLVIAGGVLVIEDGASITGAAHAAAEAMVRGRVVLDACEVQRAIAAAGMDRALPLPHRPMLPAF